MQIYGFSRKNVSFRTCCLIIRTKHARYRPRFSHFVNSISGVTFVRATKDRSDGVLAPRRLISRFQKAFFCELDTNLRSMLPGIGKHFQSRYKACPSFCPFRRFSSPIFLPVLVSTVFHQRGSVSEESIFPSMQFWLNPKL